jgi:hypothetical protein
MYQSSGGFRGEGYACIIYGSSRHGFAPTHDQAAAEWKEAYRRWQREQSSRPA